MIKLKVKIIGQYRVVHIALTYAAVCGMYTGREAMFKNLNPLVRDVRRDTVGERDEKFRPSGMLAKDRASRTTK